MLYFLSLYHTIYHCGVFLQSAGVPQVCFPISNQPVFFLSPICRCLPSILSYLQSADVSQVCFSISNQPVSFLTPISRYPSSMLLDPTYRVSVSLSLFLTQFRRVFSLSLANSMCTFIFTSSNILSSLASLCCSLQ